MRFFMSFTPNEQIPPTPEAMAKIAKFGEESMKAGKLISTGGMLPLSAGGAKMKSAGGKITVTDGPFPETKEVIVGWAIIEAASREEAIEHSKKFAALVDDGEIEIRQLMMGGPPPGM